MLGRASSAEYGSERLSERRRRSRRRGLIAFGILLCLLVGGLIWGLWQNSVRISSIVVYGTDSSFSSYAKEAMQGSYLGIVPHDSIFFFPASRIRADILADHLDIAAVSIFRNGLTGISIKMNERVPIARWCPSAGSGQTASTSPMQTTCYVFDASGYIFSIAATSTQTINSFTLHAPLLGAPPEPLRAIIAHAEKLPAVFDFARQLDTFGSPVTRVVLRGDEIDDYLKSGTRITYVLGHENVAFTALISARENMNLANGSIDYVDLRFDGKVYLKKK